jgi:Na+-transporting NADH:ubiquinone oxidoreductase subunit NqrB
LDIRVKLDPRIFQIIALATLVSYGHLSGHFTYPVSHIFLAVVGCLAVQFVGDRVANRPFNFQSSLISGLGLALLFRVDHWAMMLLACLFTIGSKFVIRRSEGHLFNPTNFAIVAMLIFFRDSVWVSPGQWGNEFFVALIMAFLGVAVCQSAKRLDVPLSFLGFYAGILAVRALVLGDPLPVPINDLGNGALLIFAFLMVSDPRTTPRALAGRLAFTFGTALVSYIFLYWFFIREGLFYSLALNTLCVPIYDRIFQGESFKWQPTRSLQAS